MRLRYRVPSALAAVLLVYSAVAPLAEAAEVYVPNRNHSVTVHDTRDSGEVPPVRMLFGPNTQIGVTFAAAVNANRQEVYVSNFNLDTVTVYPLAADGDAPALRILQGPATRLQNPAGLALDPVRNELYVRMVGTRSILVFDSLADGDVAPKRTIEGSLTQIHTDSVGIAFDPIHDEIVVASRDLSGLDSAILTFPYDAEGDVAPIRSIRGVELEEGPPYGVFVDSAHEEYLVALPSAGAVAVYPRTATGSDVTPLRYLSGADTQLTSAAGLYVDRGRDELVVTIAKIEGEIRYFPRSATGNTAPLGSVAGPATGLSSPGLLSGPQRVVFADGFESGDLSLWSSAAP